MVPSSCPDLVYVFTYRQTSLSIDLTPRNAFFTQNQTSIRWHQDSWFHATAFWWKERFLEISAIFEKGNPSTKIFQNGVLLCFWGSLLHYENPVAVSFIDVPTMITGTKTLETIKLRFYSEHAVISEDCSQKAERCIKRQDNPSTCRRVILLN